MKHTIQVTVILISMFFIAQLIGIYVANFYTPDEAPGKSGDPTAILNRSDYKLPEPFTPPEDIEPKTSVVSILVALAIAVILMLILMKLKAELVLRIWFLVVVILGIALALNTFIPVKNSVIIAGIIAIPLGLIKIFQRNLIIHNITELLIYPGIASVFIPLLSIWAVIFLLVIISVYDIYAVWHAGFMQKMAKYQIEKVRVFSGFLIPYLGKKQKQLIKKAKESKKPKKVGIQVAILGGGDVIFPMLLSGVVLATLGISQAIIIAIGATLALTFLFYISEKGKFYPAMPFISAGCFLGLLVAYFV